MIRNELGRENSSSHGRVKSKTSLSGTVQCGMVVRSRGPKKVTEYYICMVKYTIMTMAVEQYVCKQNSSM